MSGAAVEVHEVAHSYGEQPALRGVSLQIEPGERFALLGPNGSGKTTLFRVLTGLLRPDAGAARIFGNDPASDPLRARRALGVVFQQPALDGALTVAENLRFHGALYGLGGASLAARIGEMLDVFGLTDRASARVQTLSGGLARRADLARGLLHAPRLLLLDEPTTGLDPAARRAFWDRLDEHGRAEGTTYLVATHLLGEADVCDRVGVLHEGRLAALGEPGGLKNALGAVSLRLRANTPEDASALAETLRAEHRDAHASGSEVHVRDARAEDLADIYARHTDRIAEATVRAPSLEDVFMAHTGHALAG